MAKRALKRGWVGVHCVAVTAARAVHARTWGGEAERGA